MVRRWPGRLAGLAVLVALAQSAWAGDFAVGDRVVLRAENPLGVPLHRHARSSLFGRGADGAQGDVLALEHDGRWVRVRLDPGPAAWIVEKYLAPADAVSGGDPAPAPPPAAAGADAVFRSSAACEAAVYGGARLARAAPTSLRIATWNVRWFPIGDPQEPGQETDLAWLACALAWLNPDVVALQEILATRQADVAWASVIDGLEAYAGGDWRVDLQGCGGERQQHVGFLWNAERVALNEPRDLWHLNGAARDPSEPCAGNLRPGRGAYVAALPGGADFHIVGVHADSGIKARDFDHRAAVLDRLDRLYGDLTESRADPDVVVVGDFNTMGAIDRMDAEAEIAWFDAVLRGEAPGFRRIAPDLRCTKYFDGRCGWLDHVVVFMPMREAAEAVAVVGGHCAVLRGRDFDAEPPAAYRALSDHCPVVVDVANEDLD